MTRSEPNTIPGTVVPGYLPPASVEERGRLTLGHLIRAGFRGRSLILSTTVLGLLVAGIVATIRPNYFVSEGTFLVRPGGELLSLNPATNPDYPQPLKLRENAIAILHSDELFEQVVEKLGPAKIVIPYRPSFRPDVSPRDPVGWLRNLMHRFQSWWNERNGPPPTFQDALLHLKSHLETYSPRRSDTITVTYSSFDPANAKEVLTTYMAEARKRHVEAYTDVDLSSVRRDYDRARARLAAARNALKSFLEAAGVFDFDNDLKQAKEDLNQNTVELAALRNRIKTNELILSRLEKRLTKTEPFLFEEEPVTETRPRVAVLEGRISELEEELTKAKETFQPGAKEITRIENLLASARRELAAENARGPLVRVRKRKVRNPEWKAIRDKIFETKLSLEIDRQAEQLAAERRKETKARLDSLLARKEKVDKLESDVRRAELDFRAEEERMRLATRKNLAAQEGISALGVIAHPNLPLEKAGPNRFKIMLGGLFGGFFFGLFLVTLGFLTDRRVRRAEDLEDLGLEVLAVLPRMTKKNIKRHKALRVLEWSG